MPQYRAMGYNPVDANDPVDAAFQFAKRTAMKCGKIWDLKLIKTSKITTDKTRVVIDIIINNDSTLYTFLVETYIPKRNKNGKKLQSVVSS